MNPPLSWPLVSAKPRTEALGLLRDLVNQWGDLVDYQVYSDVAALLRVEVAGRKLPDFWDALSLSFRLVVPRPQAATEQEVTVALAVTFLDATGDLSQPVPAVPG